MIDRNATDADAARRDAAWEALKADTPNWSFGGSDRWVFGEAWKRATADRNAAYAAGFARALAAVKAEIPYKAKGWVYAHAALGRVRSAEAARLRDDDEGEGMQASQVSDVKESDGAVGDAHGR